MGHSNIKLTAIETDYKQHVANQVELKESAVNRLIQIRKEINILHTEEAKLELIRDTLTTEINLR
jgi:hypothetical protein